MSEFDWVEARTDCTLEKQFDQLSDAVQSDLQRHGVLNPGLSQCQRFETCRDGSFYVERPGVHRVVFTRERGRIHIVRWAYMGESTPLMALTVRLDDDGKCVLIDAEGTVLKPWQVRRRALEETLFG